MSRTRYLIFSALASLALTAFCGCHRAAFNPSKPATIAGVLNAYEVTVCAMDSTADNFAPTARENRQRLAEAAKGLAGASGQQGPEGAAFPGYYLLADLPQDEDLRIDLPSRGVVSIRGNRYTGGEALWDVVAELLPVSPAEHGLLGPLYSATEVTVRVDRQETGITDPGTIAALARKIGRGVKEGEIPLDLGTAKTVIVFTDGDSYVEVPVYEDYAQVSVWYFRQEGVAGELLDLVGVEK